MLVRLPRGCQRAPQILLRCVESSSRAFVGQASRCSRHLRVILAPRHGSSVADAARRRGRAHPVTGNLSAATVICHGTVDDVGPSQILAKLKPLACGRHRDGQACSAILVISKGIGQLADDQKFLGQVVERLFGSQTASPPVHVHALVAVVDRMSKPQISPQDGIQSTAPSHAAVAHRDGRSPSIGFEGLAYVANTSGRFSTHVQSHRNEQLSENTGILSMQTRSESADQKSLTTIELPLADTLFINGRRSTLLETQWQRLQDGQGFEPVETQPQTRVLVKLSENAQQSASVDAYDVRQILSGLSLPLLPLTPPHKVIDCMGNVLRSIQIDESTTAASHELEHSIANYFAERGLLPQPVQVWALVIPQHMSHVICDHPQQHSPSELLWKGATLHRVLSGGGGWGKKAGLISLDPGVNFSHNPLDSLRDFPGLGGDSGNPSGRQSVAASGDYVAFYLLNSAVDQPFREALDLVEEEPGDVAIEFGVGPETADVPGSEKLTGMDFSTGSTVEAADDRCEVFDDYFGVLSERGFSLMRERLSEGSNVHETKIDMPFASLSGHLRVVQHGSPAPQAAALKSTESPKRRDDATAQHVKRKGGALSSQSKMSTDNGPRILRGRSPDPAAPHGFRVRLLEWKESPHEKPFRVRRGITRQKQAPIAAQESMSEQSDASRAPATDEGAPPEPLLSSDRMFEPSTVTPLPPKSERRRRYGQHEKHYRTITKTFSYGQTFRTVQTDRIISVVRLVNTFSMFRKIADGPLDLDKDGLEARRERLRALKNDILEHAREAAAIAKRNEERLKKARDPNNAPHISSLHDEVRSIVDEVTNFDPEAWAQARRRTPPMYE